MTMEKVEAAIPHRPPFLFVDEIIERAPERVLVRTKAHPEADYFKGHFPGRPVMPGVLVCECAFQAGAVLMAERNGRALEAGTVPALTRINKATFKRMVRPGDVLDVEVTLEEEMDSTCFMTGRISSGGKPVARVEFACTLVDVSGSHT